MPDKNFVAMAQKMCPVCGIIHEHNTDILIDKYLKDVPEDKRMTGYGLCEEHDKLFQDGYLALVVADESKSTVEKREEGTDIIKTENAHRTGDIMHIRREVFNNMFNTQSPASQEMVFINIELFNSLKAMQEQTDEADTETKPHEDNVGK